VIKGGISPVFNDILRFKDFEEVHTSVYKVRKVVLPIFAALAAFWAGFSIWAALAVAILVRNWESSTTSPSEFQPLLSDKETRENLINEISDVSKLSQIAQEEYVKQVKEIGETVAVTGNLVGHLGRISTEFAENLNRIGEETKKTGILADKVETDVARAKKIADEMEALNRKLDAIRAAKSGKSSTPAE